MSKKKSANALTAVVILAVAGWALFLQKYMNEGSDSGNPADEMASGSAIQEEKVIGENGPISPEELARLEREKEEALRLAKLQMEQAKAEQERRIAEVQARLAREEAARAEAEAKARQTQARLDALAASLDEAKDSYAKLASESAENSNSQKAEMASVTAAIEAAQKEAALLKRQQEELEQQRLVALAEQERIEAELRAELEKYKRIEDWDYSYPVLPEHFKRAAHISLKAKMKANPNP